MAGDSRTPGRESWVITLRVKAGNDQCADCRDCDCEKCGFPDPVWASTDLGIIICDECKSLHESVTKVEFKSILSSHEWTEEESTKMEATCNKEMNEIYEKRAPPGYQKPTRCFNRAFREHWLVSKYIKRHFMAVEKESLFPKLPSRTENISTSVPAYLKIGKKTGYLWKRGRDDDMFQKRWFEFSIGSQSGMRASLVYYTDANKQNLRGDVSLKDVHVCLASEDKIRHPNGLQFIIEEESKVRMIYLYADLEKDMIEWYQAICIVKFWVARFNTTMESRQPIDEQQILQNLNHEILLEGSLQKTDSSARRAFRRRWCILYGKSLMYFNNELDANPIKVVRLGSHTDGFSLIMTGDHHPQWPKGGFHFLLKTPGRVFTFSADTESERQAWYRALFRACNPNKCQARPQPPPRPSSRNPLPCPPTKVQLNSRSTKDSLPDVPKVDVQKPEVPQPQVPKPEAKRRVTSQVSVPLLDPPIPSPRSHSPARRISSDVSDRDSQGYLQPIFRPSSDDVPPPVMPRPAETLPGYVPSIDRQNSDVRSDDDDFPDASSESENEEVAYIEMDVVPIICTKVDGHGTCVKAFGFCLRIPHGAIDTPKENKCFISVTPHQRECPVFNGNDLPGINAYSAHVVECRSFNYHRPLLKPLQLEIPHCANIGDLNECRVTLWHKTLQSDETLDCWRQVPETNAAITCRVKQRCLQLTTLHLGSYTFLLDGPGILGKAMQMAIFTRASAHTEVVTAHIYLFNNISSDSVWTNIEEKEFNAGAVLSDVSTSFSIQRDGSDLSLTLHDIDGLQLDNGQLNVLTVPQKKLWQSPFTMLVVKFINTAHQGKANITLKQTDSTGGDSWQENAVFSFLADCIVFVETLTEETHTEHGAYCTPFDIAKWQAQSQHLITPAPGSRGSIIAGEDAYVHLDFYPLPARHTSERREAQRKQSLRHYHASLLRQRLAPLSRTTPRGFQKKYQGGSEGEASSSTTTSETSTDGSGQATQSTSIPQGLKEDLSQLLDDLAEYGNDWSMLARYLGLDHLMHRFIVSSRPTITLLDCCESMGYTLAYIEEAVKAIERKDAASLISNYISRKQGSVK
nr:uncharacterized protein LOC129264688 isoform X1 [Lytechinus pictus]